MARARLRLTDRLRRFARAQRGATAIEFAIIATPFLMLMFGIIELGLVFMVSITLQNATDAAARKIRTGEFQSSGANTKSDFKSLVCADMSWLSGACASALTVDVQTLSSFTTLSTTGQADPTAFDANNTCWSSGQPGDIVLVRTYYQWTIFTPLLSAALVNMGSGSDKRLISAAASFRNEPWSTTAPTGAKCT